MGTDIHGVIQSRYRDGQPWFTDKGIEDERNYRVFAALADVRNGYGFAGIPTHKAITPISTPRGLPADFEYDEANEDGWLGDHSFSWLTIKELVEWPGWDQTLKETGVISREAFADWVPGSTPSGWSGDIRGGGVIVADATAPSFPDGWTHVRIGWERPLRDACELFLMWLAYINAKYSYVPQMRMVFGFDS
jgi:hypothetical protein